VWLDTVVTGFMQPDDDGIPAHESFARETLEETIGDVARSPGVVRYLASRLGEPAGAGCEVATITTQPGSRSQRNAQRNGFGLLYVRAILVLNHGGPA